MFITFTERYVLCGLDMFCGWRTCKHCLWEAWRMFGKMTLEKDVSRMKKGKCFLDLIITINDRHFISKKYLCCFYNSWIRIIKEWLTVLSHQTSQAKSSFYNTILPLVSQTYLYGEKLAFIFSEKLGADSACLFYLVWYSCLQN